MLARETVVNVLSLAKMKGIPLIPPPPPPSLSLCHLLITLDSVSVTFRSSALKVTVTFL